MVFLRENRLRDTQVIYWETPTLHVSQTEKLRQLRMSWVDQKIWLTWLLVVTLSTTIINK